MKLMNACSTRGAVVVTSLLLVSTLHAQGITYDIKTTGTGVDPRAGAEVTRVFMAGHGQFANGKSRVDITESMSPGMMGAGTYTITNTAKGTTTMVNPAKREYLEINAAELAKTAADLQASVGGMMKTEISNVKVNIEDLGAGETMDGYSTVKYRLTESYTTKVTVMGRSTESSEQSSTDIWIAPQLDNAMNPTARPVAAGSTAPTAELTAEIMKAYAKVRKGVVMKTVRTSDRIRGGKSQPSTMTMIVSNVKRGSISASVFEVPAGYTEAASIADAVGPMGAMADSMKAAQARARRKPPQ